MCWSECVCVCLLRARARQICWHIATSNKRTYCMWPSINWRYENGNICIASFRNMPWKLSIKTWANGRPSFQRVTPKTVIKTKCSTTKIVYPWCYLAYISRYIRTFGHTGFGYERAKFSLEPHTNPKMWILLINNHDYWYHPQLVVELLLIFMRHCIHIVYTFHTKTKSRPIIHLQPY